MRAEYIPAENPGSSLPNNNRKIEIYFSYYFYGRDMEQFDLIILSVGFRYQMCLKKGLI